MKYLLALMLLASCKPNGSERVREDGNVNPTYSYRIVVIDSCQYIEFDIGVGYGAMYSLTHKGNCNNHK